MQNESGLAKRLELVGSFKLLPLTKKGVEAVERGHATGSTLTAVHITSSRSKASGFYVGDVVATTATAKGDLLAYLDAALSSIKHDDVAVYARPLTSDGLRVMTGYGFVSITDDRAAPQIGHMCRLYVGGNRTGGRRQRQKRRTSASSADLDADSANSRVTAKTAS